MEEPYKNIDRVTKKLVKEAGTHTPPSDFLTKVMSRIESAAQPIVYKPLISKRAWILVAALFIGWLIVLYYYPDSQYTLLTDYNLTDKLAFENPFSGIELSKTMMYGIGFLGLFLVQIPFLKKYITRNLE